jgi:hypothetical protein
MLLRVQADYELSCADGVSGRAQTYLYKVQVLNSLWLEECYYVCRQTTSCLVQTELVAGHRRICTRYRYSNAITGLDRPLGLQEVEAVRFIDNRHILVVRLSALSTGRLYPTGNIPGTHFC